MLELYFFSKYARELYIVVSISTKNGHRNNTDSTARVSFL